MIPLFVYDRTLDDVNHLYELHSKGWFGLLITEEIYDSSVDMLVDSTGDTLYSSEIDTDARLYWLYGETKEEPITNSDGFLVAPSGVYLDFYNNTTEIGATPFTIKGSYNYWDMNRVELDVSILSDMFSLGLTTKTDWTADDIPSESDMTRFFGNINAIYEYGISIGTNFGDWDLESFDNQYSNFTYEYANTIEGVLYSVYTHAQTGVSITLDFYNNTSG